MDTATEAVNRIPAGFGDGLPLPDSVKYYKDQRQAEAQHSRLLAQRKSAVRRVAVPISKANEVAEERKRLGAAVLEAREQLAAAEANFAMGRCQEGEVRKAESSLDSLRDRASGQRDRMKLLEAKLRAEVLDDLPAFLKIRYEEACARWIATRVKLTSAMEEMSKLAKTVDELNGELREAYNEALRCNGDAQRAVAPAIRNRGPANRAISEAVREHGMG